MREAWKRKRKGEHERMMTVKEFWERVDAIDIESREDGRFTEDEMFAIGMMFKRELDNSQKREIGGWDRIVEVLKPLDENGEVMTKGDTFRQWVKNRCYRTGTMDHNVTLLSGKTIDTLSFGDFEAKAEEIRRDLHKQQVVTRDHINAYRALIREDARMEHMRELVREAVGTLPKLESVAAEAYETHEGVEAVLLLSDLHVGALVDNFFNKFNVEIARKRVREVVRQTIAYCSRLGVKRLNVLNLGDLIENDLHLSARLLQEIDAVDQTMVAAEIVAEALRDLASAVPEVTYRSCLDNHSRYIMDYKAAKDEESLVKLIDWYLEDRLKDTKVVFADDNLDRHIGMLELMNGDRMVFAHGHEVGVNTAIQTYTAATHSFVRYVALGHWHATKMKTFQNSKVFVNGSIKGADEYSEKHGLFGEPEQTLLIFDGDSLVNVTINLTDVK